MNDKSIGEAQSDEANLPLVIPDNAAALRLLDALERASDELCRRSGATSPATCTVHSYTNEVSLEQSTLLEPRSIVSAIEFFL